MNSIWPRDIFESLAHELRGTYFPYAQLWVIVGLDLRFIVWLGPVVLAVGAGGSCLVVIIFSFFSLLLSPSLEDGLV